MPVETQQEFQRMFAALFWHLLPYPHMISVNAMKPWSQGHCGAVIVVLLHRKRKTMPDPGTTFQDGIWGHLRRSGISPSGPRSTCPRSSTKRPSAAWRSARRGSGRGRTAGLAQVSACALRESGLRPIRPPRRLFRIRHGPHLRRRRSRSSQDTEFTVDKITFGTGLTNSTYCGFSDR